MPGKPWRACATISSKTINKQYRCEQQGWASCGRCLPRVRVAWRQARCCGPSGSHSQSESAGAGPELDFVSWLVKVAVFQVLRVRIAKVANLQLKIKLAGTTVSQHAERKPQTPKGQKYINL